MNPPASLGQVLRFQEDCSLLLADNDTRPRADDSILWVSDRAVSMSVRNRTTSRRTYVNLHASSLDSHPKPQSHSKRRPKRDRNLINPTSHARTDEHLLPWITSIKVGSTLRVILERVRRRLEHELDVFAEARLKVVSLSADDLCSDEEDYTRRDGGTQLR